MLSERAKKIKPSPTLAIDSKAKSMKASGQDIISFGVGEPDFDTPENIKEAAIHNINAKLVDDYNDIDAFAKSIADLLSNPEERDKFAQKAREIVEKKYSVTAQSIISGNIINYLIK